MRKAFIKTLIKFAKKDKAIMLLTGDLGFSVFEEFKEKSPQQYLNVGLSEQTMISIAAGLALEGKKVFVYSIIPFLLYRTLEQIRNDLCYQKLPVKLVGVGSGLSYGAQGGTHQAIEDLAVATSLPEIMVFAPGDPLEAEKIIESSLNFNLPCYIRLNKAHDPIIHSKNSIKNFKIGMPLKVRGGGEKIVIFSLGNMLPAAVEVSKKLASQGVKNCLYSIHTLKPLNKASFARIIKNSKIIITLEEHLLLNGLKSLISNIIVETGLNKKVLPFALPDKLIHTVGNQNYLRSVFGLTAEQIFQKIRKNVR